MKWSFLFLSLFCSIFLTACGGGGDSGGAASQPPSRTNQAPLVFSNPTLVIFIDESATSNTLSGGSGTGEISYSSANTEVAQVDAQTGVITVIGLGEVAITATKASDSNYNSASTSYTLNVVKHEQQALKVDTADQIIMVGDVDILNQLTGGSGDGEVSWKSSDSTIIRVDEKSGTMTALAAGVATITVTKAGDDLYNSINMSYPVEVEKHLQMPIVFSKTEDVLYIDQAGQTNSFAGGAGEGMLTWSSSDPDIVSIDPETGEMTFHQYGQVVITITKAEDAYYQAASASYTLTISKYDPYLGFSQNTVTGIFDGPSVVNPITYDGDGDILYSSSDEAVLTVDPDNGNVTLIQPGTAVVTAQSSATNTYNAAQASYQIKAVHILAEPEIGISQYKTELSWQSQFGDITLYRSLEKNCDFTQYQNCINANKTLVPEQNNAEVTDNFITLEQSAYVMFENENYRSNVVDVKAKLAPFAKRAGQVMYSFAGKLWLVGGVDNYFAEDGNQTLWYNDVWSSVDGVSWVKETEHAAFSARAYHKIVVMGDAAYLIGGEEGVGTTSGLYFKADVWRSKDGILWEKLNNSAPFLGGDTGEAIVFNNKIWMIGGGSRTNVKSIYSSSDGITWDKELDGPNVPFGYRRGFSLYKFQNNLYLLGGFTITSDNPNHEEMKSDVWQSSDGRSWRLVSASTGFLPRSFMSAIEYKGRMYLIGGQADPLTNNDPNSRAVYSSFNGVDWSLSATDIVKDMSARNSVALFKDQLWLFSGPTAGYIWNSKDALNWHVPLDFSLNWTLKN